MFLLNGYDNSSYNKVNMFLMSYFISSYLVEDCQAAPCGESFCQSFEVCGKDVFGDPECQCPEGRNGPQCQNVISLCSGNKCAVGKLFSLAC